MEVPAIGSPTRLTTPNAGGRKGADKPLAPRYIGLTSIVSAGWRLRAAAGRPAAFLLGFEAGLRGKTQEDRLLLELLDPVAEAAGYELVRVRLMSGSQSRRLQIMAERPDGDMNVEDCTRLSRAISEVMDAADPIEGDYLLEVSSPGIDRPLTRLKDFETYEGLEARLELDRLADGRKRFRGELAGIEDQNVAINLEGEEETALVPFAWIVEAKLILNDELMKRGAEQRAARIESESPQSGSQSAPDGANLE
jgi:ribosome maturation factor RimP